MSGHRHFTYELADGYRSPWLWPTVEAGERTPDIKTPVAVRVAEAVREAAYEARLTREQRAARRAVRRLRDESAWLKVRPFQ
jgi:hypothetical protein